MAKKTNMVNNGHEYFRVSATVGFDANGKRLRKTFLGKSKKEAERKRDAYLEKLNQGLDAGFDKITFGNSFSEWLHVVCKTSVEISTFNRYESIHRLWILPADFYQDRLVTLQNKSIRIQKHINSIESPYTAEWVYNILSAYFKYCIRERLITYNPLLNVKLPKKPTGKSNIQILSKEQRKIVKTDFLNNPDSYKLIYVFGMLTGMRSGEICALTPEDIDFESFEIDISKSVRREKVDKADGTRKVELLIKGPKTKSSFRVIPLPKSLVGPLKEHIKIEKLKHLKKGVQYSSSTFLFTSSNCTALRADRLNSRWKKYQKTLGFNEVITFHGLRHTFCSSLAEAGVHITAARDLMGHSSTEETDKIYTHVEDRIKSNAIDLIDNAITF